MTSSMQPPEPPWPAKQGPKVPWPAPAPAPGMGPPPPPGAWSPARTGLSAALILVAVLSILYAIGCGCLTLSWQMIVAGLDTAAGLPREQAVASMEHQLDDVFAKLAAQAVNADERRQREQAWAILKKHGLVGHTYDAFMIEEARSARGRLKTLGWIGAGIQVGFLALGIMLFARARVARGLGLLVCATALVVNVLTTLAFQDLGGAMVRHLGPVLEEVFEQESVQSAGERAPFEKFQRMMEYGSEAGPVVAGGISCLWPFVALLVLAISAGIRRDLGLDPPPQLAA